MKRCALGAGLLALAFGVGGCATMTADPVMMRRAEIEPALACGAEGVAPEDPSNTTLCDALNTAEAAANLHLTQAQHEYTTQSSLFGLQGASALAVAGFTVFEAHPDNILAATLTGATAAGGTAALRPGQRAEIMSKAYFALQCVDLKGRAFLGSLADAEGIGGRLADASSFIARVRVALVRERAQHADEAEALAAALTELDAANDGLRATYNARAGASDKVLDTAALVERTASGQLRALSPQISAIVDAVNQTPPEQPAPAGEGGRDAGWLAEFGMTQPLERALVTDLSAEQLGMLTEIAHALADAAKDDAREPGAVAFQAIGECATLL